MSKALRPRIVLFIQLDSPRGLLPQVAMRTQHSRGSASGAAK
jgi:hypothetical protein